MAATRSLQLHSSFVLANVLPVIHYSCARFELVHRLHTGGGWTAAMTRKPPRPEVAALYHLMITASAVVEAALSRAQVYAFLFAAKATSVADTDVCLATAASHRLAWLAVQWCGWQWRAAQWRGWFCALLCLLTSGRNRTSLSGTLALIGLQSNSNLARGAC
eukprot:2212003-Amphidinium_carterae.1